VPGLRVEQFGHQRDDERLRDRLPVSDRQRAILVRMRGDFRRDEAMPFDALDRRRHAGRKPRAAGGRRRAAHVGLDLAQQPVASLDELVARRRARGEQSARQRQAAADQEPSPASHPMHLARRG